MIQQSKDNNIFLLDPIPVWKRQITEDEIGCSLDEFNNKIIQISKDYYKNWQIEVPDERHLDKSVFSKEYYEYLNNNNFYEHSNIPAVGKWHAVPTNNFLDIEENEVKLLKKIILDDYKIILNYIDINLNETKTKIDESWIQFYKNGDYKVLHNHLRYNNEEAIINIFAGGYYLDDGNPDIYQPYSGRFSFNVRNKSYLIKPTSGMIMIWPGDVLHLVHPFYGSRERVVINFNLSTHIEKNYKKMF